MTRTTSCLWSSFLLLLHTFIVSGQVHLPSNGTGWTHYGGDAGGMRYSAADKLTPQNVTALQKVWEFHTHALDRPRRGFADASFEATPILDGNTLYFTTPFDVVFALDARTGAQRWMYDPKTSPQRDGGMITSRGVSLAESPATDGRCARRLLFGTIDARLIAIDVNSGTPCEEFGHHGAVDLTEGVDYNADGFYEVTSAPAVVGDVVIVGSSVGDNQRVDSESGLVRAFDVVTGRQLWKWEPLPWARNTTPRTGAGNVWTTISADPQLGLAYLSTGSASPDYWGGQRPGDNRDANSIVALDVHTGRKVWAFQIVHHDLWDYDIAAQPLLFTFRDGTPAVAVLTKMGQVFVFDRRDGRPLFPVAERAVPPSDVPGERASPTQPFSSLPAFGRLSLPALEGSEGWRRSTADRSACQSLIAKQRYEGIYTPPSLKGSIMFPGNLGGVNWGSAAFDPRTGTIFANSNIAAYTGRLVAQHSLYAIYYHWLEDYIRDWPLWIYSSVAILLIGSVWRGLRAKRGGAYRWIPSIRTWIAAMLVAAIAAPMCFVPKTVYLSHFGHELSPQSKSPYMILRDPLVDHEGRPCFAPPWGEIAAINLNSGTLEWRTPLGSMVDGQRTGVSNFGGPIATATGLLFTAAAEDPFLRAFDTGSGKELWTGKLPAPAQATPMTYSLDGRQFVVIAAGGHADNSARRGDSVIAFALPR